jgi:hypothetical protein
MNWLTNNVNDVYDESEDSPHTNYVQGKSYQVVESHNSVSSMNVPMKNPKPFKLSYLQYFDKINEWYYKDYEDECVLKILVLYINSKRHLIKEEILVSIFEKTSFEFYGKCWNKEDGVTSC